MPINSTRAVGNSRKGRKVSKLLSNVSSFRKGPRRLEHLDEDLQKYIDIDRREYRANSASEYCAYSNTALRYQVENGIRTLLCDSGKMNKCNREVKTYEWSNLRSVSQLLASSLIISRTKLGFVGSKPVYSISPCCKCSYRPQRQESQYPHRQ